MQLYCFPELYEAVRSPDPVTLGLVRKILKQYFNGSLKSVMDPACGPGTWLMPFADDGVRLAGNDISPWMLEAAQRRLNGSAAELIEGDMRDLQFRTGPFDVAMEIAGTIGHLVDNESALAFLRSVADQVRPGGLFLLNVPFDDPTDPKDLPAVYWTVGPISIPSGGQTSVVYEIVEKSPTRDMAQMRRTVRTYDAQSYPPTIEDEYSLRVYSPESFFNLVAQVPRFRLRELYRMTPDEKSWESVALGDVYGEMVLVLERE